MRLISTCYFGHVVYRVIPIARRKLHVSIKGHGVPMYAVAMGCQFLNGGYAVLLHTYTALYGGIIDIGAA